MKVISRDAVLRILDELGAGVALRMIVGDLPAFDLVACEHCVYGSDAGNCMLTAGGQVEACINGKERDDD